MRRKQVLCELCSQRTNARKKNSSGCAVKRRSRSFHRSSRLMMLKTNRAGELLCPAAAHYTQYEFWRKCDSTQLAQRLQSRVTRDFERTLRHTPSAKSHPPAQNEISRSAFALFEMTTACQGTLQQP
jgi:hypothetical protein